MAGDLGNTGALCIFALVLLGEQAWLPGQSPRGRAALSHLKCIIQRTRYKLSSLKLYNRVKDIGNLTFSST